jgi:hypothetical protein
MEVLRQQITGIVEPPEKRDIDYVTVENRLIQLKSRFDRGNITVNENFEGVWYDLSERH